MVSFYRKFSTPLLKARLASLVQDKTDHQAAAKIAAIRAVLAKR